MRRISSLLLVGAVAACSSDARAPTAPGPQHVLAATQVTRTEIREPINTATFSVFNPCTNENIVQAVGTGVLTRIEKVNNDGTTDIKGRIEFENVVGVGEISGMQYQLKNQVKFTQEIDLVNGGFFSQEVKFVATTDGPKMVLNSVLEIAFPPGLAPVVTLREVSTECKS
ncbi:MAG TPA: hypothetical protein VJ672_06700 [Gemmatimonadaceae bacterium]|nr:hypothetical protein [Gemmatimonadaceae bacterium]